MLNATMYRTFAPRLITRKSPSLVAGNGLRAISSTPSSSNATAAPRKEETVATESLTWQKYLGLRKTRRRIEVLSAIPSTMLGAALGGSYFFNLESDQPIFGFDPFLVNIVATLGCTGLGYLIGPTFGDALFRLAHRSQLHQIEARDKTFSDHIKANRADPNESSVNNPIPDYYGEKVGSLRDYRRWLRDQAAFRRKAGDESWERKTRGER